MRGKACLKVLLEHSKFKRQLQQAVLDDYFVTFQCFPMVDYVHEQDPVDYIYGTEYDLEETLKPKRPLLDYVLAYATLPFLLFHVSLNVCLYASGRRDSYFREGFFMVFIAHSAADAVVIVHVRNGCRKLFANITLEKHGPDSSPRKTLVGNTGVSGP